MPSLPDRDGSYHSVAAAASSFFRHLLLRDFNYENVTLRGVEGGRNKGGEIARITISRYRMGNRFRSIKTSPLLLCSCNLVKIG